MAARSVIAAAHCLDDGMHAAERSPGFGNLRSKSIDQTIGASTGVPATKQRRGTLLLPTWLQLADNDFGNLPFGIALAASGMIL